MEKFGNDCQTIMIEYELKMVLNQQTLLTISAKNLARTVAECTVQHCFQTFRAGDENLDDEEDRGRLSSIENNQLKTIIEEDTLKTT
ncbi:hypothetical protein NPIL_603661 [Nephila pilipes]|uniref:Uncharacterized protein n=1 Tax=Nephila pilipes TaxID=299642 RepID=A0A8X6P1E3_NEPPI|nr:hypothetical protein NPIL_603661 [Nephila pilipes]